MALIVMGMMVPFTIFSLTVALVCDRFFLHRSQRSLLLTGRGGELYDVVTCKPPLLVLAGSSLTFVGPEAGEKTSVRHKALNCLMPFLAIAKTSSRLWLGFLI